MDIKKLVNTLSADFPQTPAYIEQIFKTPFALEKTSTGSGVQIFQAHDLSIIDDQKIATVSFDNVEKNKNISFLRIVFDKSTPLISLRELKNIFPDLSLISIASPTSIRSCSWFGLKKNFGTIRFCISHLYATQPSKLLEILFNLQTKI
jgi:hypothetical protein